MPRVIRISKVSLMHYPHFNAPLFSPVPFIATIHDLILHKFPNEASLSKRLAYRFLVGRTVHRAMRLIAVSTATKSDLLTWYPSLFSSSGHRRWPSRSYSSHPLDSSQGSSLEENTDRISVIHEGISERFRPATSDEQQAMREKYGLPEHFILYVGAAKEHKNVQTLIDACPEEVALVLVTGGKELHRLRLRPNVLVFKNVPDEDLPSLYSAALCTVSPSLAEGFNFPVLEALACGCPVIATNRGATPEICGGHCLLVEPTVEGLEGGIRRVERGKGKGESESIDHARCFTWEKAAEETAKVYAACINKTRTMNIPSPSGRRVG